MVALKPPKIFWPTILSVSQQFVNQRLCFWIIFIVNHVINIVKLRLFSLVLKQSLFVCEIHKIQPNVMMLACVMSPVLSVKLLYNLYYKQLMKSSSDIMIKWCCDCGTLKWESQLCNPFSILRLKKGRISNQAKLDCLACCKFQNLHHKCLNGWIWQDT